MHSDLPVLKVDNNGVQNQSEKWEEAFFENYLNDTLSDLPNLKELRKLTNEEAHHTPQMMMDSGLRLGKIKKQIKLCLLYTSPSPRDRQKSRMPSSA